MSLIVALKTVNQLVNAKMWHTFCCWIYHTTYCCCVKIRCWVVCVLSKFFCVCVCVFVCVFSVYLLLFKKTVRKRVSVTSPWFLLIFFCFCFVSVYKRHITICALVWAVWNPLQTIIRTMIRLRTIGTCVTKYLCLK